MHIHTYIHVARRITEVPENHMKIPLDDQVADLRSITQDACDCILRRRLPKNCTEHTICEFG